VLIDEASLCVAALADGTWEVRNPTIEWMLAYPVPSDGVPCAVIGGGALRPETIDPEQPNRFQIEPIPQTAAPALDCEQTARLFSPGTSATGSVPSREVLATTALAVFATHTAPLAEILHGSVDSPLTPDEVAGPEGLATRIAEATDSGDLRDPALPVVAEVPSSAGAFGRLSDAMLEAPTLVPRARTDDPYRAIIIELLGQIADQMETTPSLLTASALERGPISPPN
jgi:hypothetical protein